MPRLSQPFDDETLDAHARFEAHLARTYRRDAVVPQQGSVWVDTTRGALYRTITVLSVHADARIPYAEVDDSSYGLGQQKLLGFGRWLAPLPLPQEDS